MYPILHSLPAKGKLLEVQGVAFRVQGSGLKLSRSGSAAHSAILGRVQLLKLCLLLSCISSTCTSASTGVGGGIDIEVKAPPPIDEQ